MSSIGDRFLTFENVSETLLERLWARAEEKPNGCIEWTGCRHRQGYGILYDHRVRRNNRAHRISASMYLFPFVESRCVLHRCDNPACINPEHLFLGDQEDNIQDMVRKGRQRGGGLLGAQNPMSKLTNEQVLAIREEVGTCKHVAQKYQVSPMTISRIRNRKLWSHI